MILIDSSVWIEILRQRQDEALRIEVENHLDSGTAALTEPVWLELYRGAKGHREETRLASLRELCVWLEFNAACWNTAYKIGRACQRSGNNVPTGDLLVYACARQHGVGLLHRDRHFDMLGKVIFD